MLKGTWMKNITFVAIALFLSGPAASGAGDLPLPRFADPARRAKLKKALPELERVFEEYRLRRGIPGLVYGVVIDGDLVAVKTMGVRDRESNAPVTPDTVFRIASMTKSFTALAILKLRDEGKLSLDDPVSKWIPQFARMEYPTRDTAPVRVRQLLTHSAGFPEDNPWGDQQLAVSEDQLTAWLEKGLPFSTPPGTAYEYSNYGFGLLGRIVSNASGMPYRDYLEKQILAPLGMTHSTLEPSSVPADVRAKGYRKTGETYSEEKPLAHGGFGSMGGLLTSARDLARYVAFQLSAFPPRDDEDKGPVKRSSRREMQQTWRQGTFNVRRSAGDSGVQMEAGGYGYGLAVWRNCLFQHIVGHGGGLPGFGSYMLWLPEHGVGMFAMANLTYTGPRQPIEESLDILRKTGALKPRELPASPVLLSTRDAIVRLWHSWSEKEAEQMAADNLFLDRLVAERRAEIERIKEAVGACRGPEKMDAENWLRGTFRMNCERGAVDVFFTLAPTNPPRVQHLSFTRASAGAARSTRTSACSE